MPKPIVVGYDPRSADRAPVQFGMAAARFTGAPLIIASAYSESIVVGQMGHGKMHEDLGGDADQALRHIRTELSRDHHVRAECVGLPGTSGPWAHTTGCPGPSTMSTTGQPSCLRCCSSHPAARRQSAVCAGSALTLGMDRKSVSS